MNIVIIPFGGLGNRLRVILSYLREYKDIKVLWKKTPEISHDHFLDVFEPIKGVNFLYALPKNTKVISTCNPLGDWYDKDGKELISLIKPKARIIERILAQRPPDIAIHVRRTDHSKLAQSKQKFTTDQMFFDFVDQAAANLSDLAIYVATDNAQTYSLFAQRYSGHVQTLSTFNKSRASLRQTSLADSVVDWFICANAKVFMGSDYSSFTDLIRFKRAALIENQI